jgi:glycosyltransferase involved in cell wall biosynthesis
MALRLTGTSLPQAPSDPAEIAARARALLSSGDVDGYREQFSRANELEDSGRRYRLRTMLVEEGLIAASDAPAARGTAIFTAVAHATLSALEEQPSEPVLLNYAGIALYELWCLDGARALFTAALALDPTLPHARRNLAECKRRAKERGAGRRSAAAIAVSALAQRARQIAAQAQPATGLTLSLCMIVRDEEEMLPRCLAAAAPAVDEIVIVDTGSQDRTIEIARSFGARVIEREWTGSFSDARNVSFDAATSDWIIYLDADEVLVEEDVERLRSLTRRTWREAFYFVETNFTGDLGDGTALTHNALRMFRNRPEYRFEGRLHEQIAHRLPSYSPERIEQTSIRIEHYGYLGSVRDAKEKSKRNIELLRAQQAEGAPTPFLHFNLGSEYAAIEDAQSSLTEFERAWALILEEDAEQTYEFAPTLMVRLVRALRFSGCSEDALTMADEGLRRFPGFTDLVYEQATASLALNREADAIGYLERCIEMGDAPARYTATRGCGTYLPRLTRAELHLEHGELEQARPLLDWCLREHPGFMGTVLPYASALLRSGIAPAEVVAELEQRVAELTPTVLFMIGTALSETGASEHAAAQFRIVLERQPHSAQARVALGETLLAQRLYAEAAAESSAVPADDPFASIACRTELFARIMGEDRDGARVALGRAQRAGLPAAELELFAGWSELAAGSPVTRILPVEATPMLSTILEALLQVQEFKAFEALVALLERSELPRREQRELLAIVYLRRGFLASAAEEWMAVCSEQPDVRALLGLAKVASAQGLADDAATFATEALRLEPSSTAASKLLVALEQRAA